MKINLHNLLTYGLFPDCLPISVFSSESFAQHLRKNPHVVDQVRANKSKGIRHTPCHTFTCYKGDLERRIISFPHIETYFLLAEALAEMGPEIERYLSQNRNSYSTAIHGHPSIAYSQRSTFRANLFDRIKLSAGYKYLLKTDISNCYGSIYTHCLTWAMLGKSEAKRQVTLPSKERSPEYTRWDNVDVALRAINSNESTGVPTGPLTSRVVSEIILTAVDETLESKGFHFRRYVDDYDFFFKNEAEAIGSIPTLQAILHEFKLHLNPSKTTIETYPYQLGNDLRFELSRFDFSRGFLSFYERAIALHKQGSKGAIKYALMVLSGSIGKVSPAEYDLVRSHLINTMLSFPHLSDYVYRVICQLPPCSIGVYSGLNDILKQCLKSFHEAETIWLLTIMFTLGASISPENLRQVIVRAEPFSSILALDYIDAHGLRRDPSIAQAIANLKAELKQEKIYGPKWLLLYEINRNNWIEGLRLPLKSSPMLTQTCDLGIRFYERPCQNPD